MDNLPVVNFHFKVIWGDGEVSFSEITGLNAEHEVLEYRHGADLTFSTTKIPGLKKYSNIVLKRGALKDDNDSFKWFRNIGLDVERRDVTIMLLDHNHEPTIVWKVLAAWPVRVSFSELNSLKSEILIETLELAHNGLIVQRLDD